MKIKTIMSYYLTQVRGPSSKNLQAINATEDVERRKLSYTFDGNVIWYSDYGEQYEDSFKKKKNKNSPTSNPTTGHIP